MLLLALPSQLSAQYDDDGPYAELGVTIGPSNFLGDLGGGPGKGQTFLKDNNFQLTKLSVGAHFSYYPKEYIGARLALNIGRIEGDDNVINPKGGLEEARYNRNFNFHSSFFEAFVGVEFFPTVFLEDDPSDHYHKLRPYAMVGVGVFHFNPKAVDPLTGQTVELRPLRLEGQGFTEYPDRKQFSLWQPNIPMGVGVKYFLSDNFSLGLEVVLRKTFTDYIDGVSTTYIDKALFNNYIGTYYTPQQAALAAHMSDLSNGGLGGYPGYGEAGQKRGDATQKDSYYTFGIKLGFRINSGRDYSSSTRCPVLRF